MKISKQDTNDVVRALGPAQQELAEGLTVPLICARALVDAVVMDFTGNEPPRLNAGKADKILTASLEQIKIAHDADVGFGSSKPLAAAMGAQAHVEKARKILQPYAERERHGSP